MSQLVKTVVRVLNDHPGIVPEIGPDMDEVHGYEECGQGQETKGAFPANSLQWVHVVLGYELLLINHLGCHDYLQSMTDDKLYN